ncbi:MAG: hypothetical protein RL026_2817 [Pseudomonadota bacterium]
MAFPRRSPDSHIPREGSTGPTYALFAVLSIVCMVFDQRQGWVDGLRYHLEGAAHPLQQLLYAPLHAWDALGESLRSRASLRAEIAALKRRERELSVASLRLESLQRENAQLRALQQAIPPLVERSLVAEVIGAEFSPLRQRLLVNRGAGDDVFAGQAALDARGVLGQVTRVGPFGAEVILVTDPEHAVPVQLLRNGLRTIAVGAGNSSELLLPYLPINSDVKAGDTLVSSGLGGVFPAGYPVAIVTGIRRDPTRLLAQVRARPLANLDRDREIMLVWFNPAHAAAPVANPEESLPQLTLGAPPAAALDEAASGGETAPAVDGSAAPTAPPGGPQAVAPAVPAGTGPADGAAP